MQHIMKRHHRAVRQEGREQIEIRPRAGMGVVPVNPQKTNLPVLVPHFCEFKGELPVKFDVLFNAGLLEVGLKIVPA